MIETAMRSGSKYRGGFTPSPAAHLLLCGLVPNKPWTGTDLGRGLGSPVPEAASPLVYTRTCIFALVSLLFPCLAVFPLSSAGEISSSSILSFTTCSSREPRLSGSTYQFLERFFKAMIEPQLVSCIIET